MKKLMRILRLVLMAPAIILFATGGDGGGTDPNAGGGSDPNGGNDPNKGKDPNAGGGTPPEGGKEKTVPLEEAERIAAQREERARKAALKSFFEQQGYSQDEVEKLLQADKERREKEKTDLEREKEAREAAEKEKDQAIAQANARVARTEFKIAAQAAGVPADRLEAAVKLADLSELAPGDDGNIPADAVKNVVEATIKANPFLKETKAPPNVGGGGSNPGGGGGEPSIEELGKLSMEEYIRLRNAKK